MKKRNVKAMIVAKAESQEAIDNIDDLIDATDALMVARGDFIKPLVLAFDSLTGEFRAGAKRNIKKQFRAILKLSYAAYRNPKL